MEPPFKKLISLPITNPQMDLQDTRGCFLYDFRSAGFSEKRFLKWLEGRTMDIWEYTGRFTKPRKCPWCHESHDIGVHSKKESDLMSISLSKKAYPLLLDKYLRKGNYQALGFLMQLDCSYCINPVVLGREGKCAIPSSTRNRFRSIKTLGLTFDGFKGPKSLKYLYLQNIAIIY